MGIFTDAFAWILSFFYSIVPSFGFAIIALTLVVMVIITPLTLKGTRSMMMVQQLQPEIRKIQSRYKDDRQKQNEELLKFYNENNINPVGGCLPLLVQMPVFFFLYQVLRGLTLRVPVTGGNVGWVSGQLGVGQPFTTPPDLISSRTFEPTFCNGSPLDDSAQICLDLHSTTTMSFAGMDLAVSANQALQDGIVTALPYLLLIAVVAASGYVQNRQIQGRTVNQGAQQQMPGMQVMKYMWVMLPAFSFVMPAGLVLYFATSNLYRVGQQWFISRKIYGLQRGETMADKMAREGSPADDASAEGGKRSGKSARSEGAAATATKAKAPATKTKGAAETKPASTAGKRGANGSGRSQGRTAGTAAKTKDNGKGGGRAARNGDTSASRSGNGGSSTSDERRAQPRARKKKR